VPDTSSGTLASLAEQLESLLGVDPVEDGLPVALATVEMLERLVSRMDERDPELSGLDEVLGQMRHSLMETATHDIGGR
jgi:hypothetical protein